MNMRERRHAALLARAERCLELERAGLTHRQIAAVVGGHHGCISKLLLLVRPSRTKRLDPNSKAQIAQDYAAGIPRRAISKKFGVSPRWVSSLAREMGEPARPMFEPKVRNEVSV
jgi:IS30 family transposase